MATTVKAGFETLKSNLEITGLQQSTVSTRQNNVRDAVTKDLIVLNSFLTGSYARSTMIAPLKDSDIDIFVVMDVQYYNWEHPEYILDKVKNTLLKTYTTPKISRNGQAVTLTFSDFIVDVVPAFNRKGGGYLIPNTYEKTWIATDPTVHASLITDLNKKQNGNLVPIIKMIKCWNRYNNYPFTSFYLELLALDIFNNVTISNYSSGVRFFFDKAKNKITKKATDPSGYGGQVNGYQTGTTNEKATKLIDNSYNLAINAENYEKNGYIKEAINNWKSILGDKFPSYC